MSKEKNRCPYCGATESLVTWNGEGAEEVMCYNCAMERLDNL